MTKYILSCLFLLATIINPRVEMVSPWLVVPPGICNGSTNAQPILQNLFEQAEAKNETIAMTPGACFLASPIQVTAPVNVVGCGVHCSELVTTIGQPILQFNHVQTWPVTHAGTFSDIGIDCDWGGTTQQGSGIDLTDTIGMTFRDMSINNCANSVIFATNTSWDERNVFDHITLSNFSAGFLFQGPFTFGHNWLLNIEYNTGPGDALVRLAGYNTAVFNLTLTANGNMSGGGCVFDLTGGQALVTENNIFVMAESTGGDVGFCGGPNGDPTFTPWWGAASAVVGHGVVSISGGTPQSGPFSAFQFVP
jgi:hypothetical protein